MQHKRTPPALPRGLRVRGSSRLHHASLCMHAERDAVVTIQSTITTIETTMSSKDSTNSSMIASDYKEPHELPSLPAGLSADSLLVSALTEGGRKSSMRDLSASRFGGGDTSGLPRSPTKSVVINLPEEPPSKRMSTHTNAAPIDAVVSGTCLSFRVTLTCQSHRVRKNCDVNDTSQEGRAQ